MKSVSKKGRGGGGGRGRGRGRAPSLREKPVCGLSSHSAKLRAEKAGRVDLASLWLEIA